VLQIEVKEHSGHWGRLGRIGLEPACEIGLEARLVAFGIERRLSTSAMPGQSQRTHL
jgi:hypothetical protein